jgi:valyl-tRNA synthetase
MLYKFNEAVKKVRNELDNYRFNDASMTLYRFLWQDFCDWGIELSKTDKESVKELGAIYKESMKLLHPFVPFITEYLYQTLNGTKLEESESIMVKQFPKIREVEKVNEFDLVIETITSLRRAKALVDMPNNRIAKALVKANIPEWTLPYIEKLAKVEKIELTDSKVENAVADISDNVETFIPLNNIDLTPIISRLEKQKTKLNKDKEKLNKMLSNENFVKNAPTNIIEKNRTELAEIIEKLSKIENELTTLKG